MYIPESDKHAFYLDGKEYEDFTKAIEDEIKHKENFLKKQIKACNSDGKTFIEASKKCSENAEKKSNKDLAKNYNDYLNKFEAFYFHMWAMHPIEDYLENTLEKQLKVTLKDMGKSRSFKKYLQVLTEKTAFVEAEREQTELLGIAEKAESEIDITSLIERHAEKYGWLPFYSFDLPVWEVEHFTASLSEVKNPTKELQKIKDGMKKKKERLKNLKRELKTNKTLLETVELLQKYLVLRTDRTDVFRKAIFHLRPFLFEINGKVNLSYEEVIYLTPDEIIKFLENATVPDIKEIKRRQQQFLIICKSGKPKLISNKKEVQEIIKSELEQEDSEVGVIKGRPASQGKARGKVIIIKTIRDISKVNKGDILVASMTTPDMVIGMRKAAAIVTDEGGVTSHAAIVSRELGVPCVIATKIATKVLKDGDMVKVDAIRGEIEII